MAEVKLEIPPVPLDIWAALPGLDVFLEYSRAIENIVSFCDCLFFGEFVVGEFTVI